MDVRPENDYHVCNCCCSGKGAANVVLTAVMCTAYNGSAFDVTLGGVESEFTLLPLVLVRGPVRLRDALFSWWQVETIYIIDISVDFLRC